MYFFIHDIINLEIIVIVTKFKWFPKLLVILCYLLTAVAVKDESVTESIINSDNTITGKLMQLCLAKCIMYILYKVHHIIYFNGSIFTAFSIKVK